MGVNLRFEISQLQDACHHTCITYEIPPRNHPSLRDLGGFLERFCTPQGLVTCWQILFVAFCSVITTSYTLQNEPRLNNTPSWPPKQAFKPGHFTFIFDPSPAILLTACIIEGCTISSFAYRSSQRDGLQAPIFVFAITAAVIGGIVGNVGANAIMLAAIPWAVVGAMVVSSGVRWVARRRSKPGGRVREEGFIIVKC